MYAGGLSPADIAIAAGAQRPITAEALGGVLTAAPSRPLPSWQIVATADHAVPTELQLFLAARAGSTVIEADSGYDVPAARPEAVVAAIAEAAVVLVA